MFQNVLEQSFQWRPVEGAEIRAWGSSEARKRQQVTRPWRETVVRSPPPVEGAETRVYGSIECSRIF